MIANDNTLLLRPFQGIFGGKLYNDLPLNSLYNFEQLANLFIEYLSMNIKKRVSITNLMKLSQFDQDLISYYIARWMYLIINMK